MRVRAFVAIELESDVRDALASLSASIRERQPTWAGEKWVRPGNLHVTIAFLGALEHEQLDPVLTALSATSAALSPFELEFDRFVARPSPQRATMLWAIPGIGANECVECATAVAGHLERVGVSTEVRAFRPHVTLVRTRRPQRIADGSLLAASEQLRGSLGSAPHSMSVRCITMFSSTLTRSGPVYEPIAVLPFTAV